MDPHSSGQFQKVKHCKTTKKPWIFRASLNSEATGGFEPPNEGFADCYPHASRKCQIPRKGFPKPNEGLQVQIDGPLFGLLNRYGIIIKNPEVLSTTILLQQTCSWPIGSRGRVSCR